MHFANSDETCAWVREQTDFITLGLSGGKDSTCALIKCLQYWDRDMIGCFHQNFVPGGVDKEGYGTLRYLEEHLAYLEEFFQIKIFRIPHFSFYFTVGHKYGQPSHRFDILEHLILRDAFPILEAPAYTAYIRKMLGIESSWNATGIRMHDNLMRRTAIKKHGSAAPGVQNFYPVWDYTAEDVRRTLDESGVKLSGIEYQHFSRSLGGVDARFVWPIRQYGYEEDWEAIKFWYPLVDVDIFRYECREKLLAEGITDTPIAPRTETNQRLNGTWTGQAGDTFERSRSRRNAGGKLWDTERILENQDQAKKEKKKSSRRKKA